MHRLAALPGASEPSWSSTPRTRAGVRVTARRAVSGSSPSLTASAACTCSRWIGTTGWSVMMPISTPAAASFPGLASERRLGAVVDHQPVAELVGQPQGGGDVVGAVAVLAPGDLAAQHQRQRLPPQVALDRLAVVAAALVLVEVVGGLHEALADHRGGAEPGRRVLLALAVDTLGVLAA